MLCCAQDQAPTCDLEGRWGVMTAGVAPAVGLCLQNAVRPWAASPSAELPEVGGHLLELRTGGLLLLELHLGRGGGGGESTGGTSA